MKNIEYHYNIVKTDPIVFSYPTQYNFGDKIAVLNMHKFFEHQLNKTTFLSLKNVTNECDIYLAKLFFDDEYIIWGDSTYNTYIADEGPIRNEIFSEIYKNKYIKFTLNKTSKDTSVVYSFDCQSYRDLKIPPYTPYIVELLKNHFDHINFIYIGKHLGVKQTLESMINSRLILTVDSGIGHLGRCTDTPQLFIEYKFNINHAHPRQFYTNYTTCKSIDEIIKNVSLYV